MHKIDYNSDYFSLVKDISSIQPSIIFTKSDDKIVVLRSNKARTIVFKILAPASFFTFEGDKIAFFDFAGFYNAIGAFGPSSLHQKDNKIIIMSANGKTNYVLSAPEALMVGPSALNFGDTDVTFDLSDVCLKDIVKTMNMIKAEMVDISYNHENRQMIFKLYNTLYGHSHDKEFPITSATDGLVSFDFTIKVDMLSHLPSGKNYAMRVKKEGHIGAQLIAGDVDLFIATSRIRKIDKKD